MLSQINDHRLNILVYETDEFSFIYRSPILRSIFQKEGTDVFDHAG